MAYKIREEIVGKRFLSIKSEAKHRVSKISEWEWRPGFVRAVSTRDTRNADFTVLVEFDDTGWKSREYIKVHDAFLVFLVEHTLAWVERTREDSSSQGPWPALCFRPVVDKVGLFRQSKRPVEFLNDRTLIIVEESDIKLYKESDENTILTSKEYPDIVRLVKAWTDYQDGQKILLTTPTVLLGYRVEVYRTEGTTQWYTAVIKSYNHANKSLTLTDDTVLEEHNEDPALIQMHLIGDGVVDSILNGVDVGVAQRRRPRSSVSKQNSKDSSSIININRGVAGHQTYSGGFSTQAKHCGGITSGSASTLSATTNSSSKADPSQQKNQKQASKRKLDPQTKAAKKYVAKRKKEAGSEENLETSSSVCKQTCNVVVKRIEEESKIPQSKEECTQKQQQKLKEKPTHNKRSLDLEGVKATEPSENTPSPVNSSKGHGDSLLDVSVCDSNEKQCSDEPETKKFKCKVKEAEGTAATDVLPKEDDRKQFQGPLRAVDEENLGRRASCDDALKLDAHTSDSASTLSNGIINCKSPSDSKKGPDRCDTKEDTIKQDTVKTKELTTHFVNEKSEILSAVKETLHEKESTANNPVIGVEISDSRPEEDMHYKKQIIRAGGNISPSHNAQTQAISECIDINRSLTDQLSKAKNSDKYSLNGDGKFKPEAGEIMDKISSSSSSSSSSMLSPYRPAEIERAEGNSFAKTHEVKEGRQSAFTCVQPSVSRSNLATPAALDRTDSRASDGQLSGHLSEEKLAGSRCEEVRCIRSSPRTSPLVSDRHEAVNPYRDPELMRKNPVQSSVQNMLAAQHKMNQSAFPSVHAPVPGSTASSQAAVTFTGVQTLPAGSLLSTLPYTNAHQLPPALSHHLAIPHGYSMDAVVRAQHLAALQQQHHLLGLTLGSANTMASLEALWQHKLPATALPTPYMLQKNQDILLAPDLASALHREHFHLQLDHERRELERIEIERRERLEQELREKERKEILERERQEKEKAERDKIERERLERERLEKERERHKWELKQNQERVLDTEAAVDQHFAESLTRLASQQRISMFPNISGGTGRGLVPKTEPHHGLPPHGMSYEKMYDHRADNQIKKEVELADEKRYMKPDCEKSSVFSGYPYGPGGYHPGSVIPQASQKPFFNLYGYPSSHSTITPEQLKQRGLNPELKQVKEEMIEKKHSYSSVTSHAATPVNLNQVYSSKDIKREPHNSVIVKRDIKLKMENPVAAHSHHSSSSSSSPRPQQPRPAHTPEHHRSDRPLASSTSPALGRHPHHLHHSSPVPADSSHPSPSNSAPSFRSIEAHPPSRSQSPYKPAASQLQSQPLNFCKTSGANKLQEQQQQHPSHVHSGFPSVAQLPVSVPSSASYSYSLIQQGLVPNPIYSHTGSSHPPGVPQISQVSIAGPSPVSGLDPSCVQLSPPGNKRKTGSKDISSHSRKKPKGHPEVSVASHPMSIPETTPQVFINSSPYTTTSGASLLTKPGVNSVGSSSSPSSVGSSHSHINSGFMDSFKSFVENTVQNAFLQDEKKAQETAERERTSTQSLSPGIIKNELNSHERKPESSMQPLTSSPPLTASPATNPDVPQPNTVDSYNSRIMDTINRVANNQADTDSDTLSASSPPPHIKPSDTNSPLSRSGNNSGSSHPHHMKKAWLQRHDEDKKSETPVPAHCEEDSNSSLSHCRDTISCVENPSVPLPDCGQSSNLSPADVVVTLSNGNVNDLSQHSDESTSSASESEMQSTSKTSETQKRAKSHRSRNGSSKKVRSSDVDKEETSPSRPLTPCSSSSNSNSSSQKKANVRRSKTDKEGKAKEKNSKMPVSATASSSSPHSEHSNPSPALSESNIANMSPASSTSSNSNTLTAMPKLNSSGSKEIKDKKKSEYGKEHSRDSKKSSSFNKPLVKMTVSILKRTMMPFIQDGSCSEITPKLNKCRECKMTPIQRSKKQPNIFCRFYAFRRLKYNSRGIVTIHGFSELSDADPDDIEPWLPRYPVEEPELDVENSKFIIAKVGDKFCELVEQEKEAKSWAGDNVNIVWKRAVVGVREMCDVCDTTLFNMHWVCHKCGFVVCLDCYEVRMKEGKKGCNDDKWLMCSSNRQAHKASEMMLTQIIPSDALWELGRLIHDIRLKWSIPSNCPCGGSNVENKVVTKNGINQLVNAVGNRKIPNGYGSDEHGGKHLKSKNQQESDPLKNLDAYNPDNASSPLSILAEVASMEPDSNRDKSNLKRKADKPLVPEDELLEESDKKSGCSTLRELLTKTAGKPKGTNDKRSKKSSGLSTLDNIIQSVVEKSCSDGGAPFKFLHYTPRLGGWKRELPIMVHNLTETSVLYPDVPHSWLCDGRLLRLHDGHHKGNLQIFQEQWKRGQPVLVSCANKKMNINIWKPELFTKEFGHIENEVVNCRTGDVIIGHTMGDFWGGFENLGNRPTDSKGHPMLLKLKDWPPGDDFSELLPSRFQDLMNALPLPEYTQRNGKLNLASRLPDFLVRPDLGPKMYNAYGSSQFPKEGTTNLHLDISDAVNVMVYVGIPSDGPGGRKAQEEAAVKAIDDAGCDSITKRRVREVHEIPGALWHIYDAHDADKIRDFLNKVAKERGESIEKDHDAIHDQSWYLDKELCDRLLKEYGVQGYTIVQCLGDAIFIPAGAPHQVRNLHSCIKVAEDFVSPEHLNHCFRLTQEFRQLSETHTNHEDKLQVKNIIYHAVKDAIAVLREHSPDDE